MLRRPTAQASGFVPGTAALVQDHLVTISLASLCREGLVLHLQQPLERRFAAGTPVQQLPHPSTSDRAPSSCRPATRDGGAWRDGPLCGPHSDPLSTPQAPRPATGDGLQGGSSRRGDRRPAPWSPPKVRATCEASLDADLSVFVKLAL